MYVGTDFCPSLPNAKVHVDVYYSDLTYTVLNESLAYPLQEMVNELFAIFQIYFPISLLTSVTIIDSHLEMDERKKS